MIKLVRNFSWSTFALPLAILSVCQLLALRAGIAFISLAGIIINSLVFQFEKRWLFWHYRDSISKG